MTFVKSVHVCAFVLMVCYYLPNDIINILGEKFTKGHVSDVNETLIHKLTGTINHQNIRRELPCIV
jgi:hypothetical protein